MYLGVPMQRERHTHVTTINEKEAMNLKKGVYGRVWKEVKEGVNDVIILKSQKLKEIFLNLKGEV